MISPQHAKRRLRRVEPPVVGGVAAGVARYVGLPANFVRITLVALALFAGIGIVLYVAGWLLIPLDDHRDARPLVLTSSTPSLVAGFVVLALGAVGLIDDDWPLAEPQFIVPVLIVGGGFALLNRRADGTNDANLAVMPVVTPAPPVHPRDATLGHPVNLAADPSAGPPPWDTPDRATPWAVTNPDNVPPRPERSGPPVTSITLAVAAVDIGVFLVLVNIARLGISATTLLGSLLAVLGAGMVASAIYERALVLYPLAALTLALLAVAPLIDTTFAGGVGTRDVSAVTEDSLETTYSMGIGELIVDLSDLRLTSDRTVIVEVGAGYTEIEIPDDVRVEILATSRAGYVEVLRASDEGVRNQIYQIVEGTDPTAPTLRIEASTTFGYVKVFRRGL